MTNQETKPAMVVEQEPVAWMGIPVMPGRYKEAVFCSDKDLASQWDYSGHTGLGRLIVTPLYAAPVAQQPQADSIPVTAYDRLQALCESQAQRIIELEDKQPQAEAVPTNCTECRNADSWGVPDQPVCRSCRAGSAWEPLNKSSVNPNKKPQAEAVPSDVVRDANIEAAAKKMAEIFDYPWDFMPEKGRNTMRENVRAVLDAAIAQQKGGV